MSTANDVADRDQLRASELSQIKPAYSPLVHILTPTLFGGLVIGVCLLLLKDPRPLEWLMVPAIWVLSNASEWRMHRDWLHKRTRLVPALYDRHTPIHHRLYVTDDMQVRSWREMKFVLIPAWAAVALFVGLVPIALLVSVVMGDNAALLFMATCMFYVVSYELMHASYHLPLSCTLMRIGWCRRLVLSLSRHHALHHDPRLMQQWNMNVTVPLWDMVRKTRLTDAQRTAKVAQLPLAKPENARAA